ncbi:hypothetical protein Mgra_00009905 [Meloidogyne graminicola]|uniref:Uncharacterized protein n=1 Tax=Meloidogyne graminicola TaxID=189291 RepID=A0A8S9ZCV8_9BILA|nr:hypothetical protein Mgra_00009905 [Meloidogyne graminicola]
MDESLINRTSVSFCLSLAAENENLNIITEEGCWHDLISNGIQCLCQKDFCNSPRNKEKLDLTQQQPPIEGLKMLKKNPFVDYEYLEEEKSIITEKKQLSSSSSESINSLLSSLDDSDNGDDDRNDLMPIPFDDYMNWFENKTFKNFTIKDQKLIKNNQKFFEL